MEEVNQKQSESLSSSTIEDGIFCKITPQRFYNTRTGIIQIYESQIDDMDEITFLK